MKGVKTYSDQDMITTVVLKNLIEEVGLDPQSKKVIGVIRHMFYNINKAPTWEWECEAKAKANYYKAILEMCFTDEDALLMDDFKKDIIDLFTALFGHLLGMKNEKLEQILNTLPGLEEVDLNQTHASDLVDFFLFFHSFLICGEQACDRQYCHHPPLRSW